MQFLCVFEIDTFCAEALPTPTCVYMCAVAIYFHGEYPMVEFKVPNLI